MNNQDVRIDGFRNESGVRYRVTHMPTGIVIDGEECESRQSVFRRLAEAVAERE